MITSYHSGKPLILFISFEFDYSSTAIIIRLYRVKRGEP